MHHHQSAAWNASRSRQITAGNRPLLIISGLFMSVLLLGSIIAFHHISPSIESGPGPIYGITSLRGSSLKKLDLIKEPLPETRLMVPGVAAGDNKPLSFSDTEALPPPSPLLPPAAPVSPSKGKAAADGVVMSKALTIAPRRDMIAEEKDSSSSREKQGQKKKSQSAAEGGEVSSVALAARSYQNPPAAAAARERAASSSTDGQAAQNGGMWQKLFGGKGWNGGDHRAKEGSILRLGGDKGRRLISLAQDENYLASYKAAVNLDEDRQKRLANVGGDDEGQAGVIYAIDELLLEVRGNRTLAARSSAWDSYVEDGITRRLWSMIEKELPIKDSEAFTFIEWIGQGLHQTYLGLSTAHRYGNSTVLSVRSNATSQAISMALRAGHGLDNLLLCSGPSGEGNGMCLASDSLLMSLRSALGPKPCSYQFIQDISMIASTEALPHEVETVVGHALALCQTTFLPSGLPDHRFFDYWDSVADLVEAGANRVGLKVEHKTIDHRGSSRGYSSRIWRSYAGENEGEENGALAKLQRVDVLPHSGTSGMSLLPSSYISSRESYSARSSGLSDWLASSSHGASASSNVADTTSIDTTSGEIPSLASITATSFSLRFLTPLAITAHDTIRLITDIFRLASEANLSLDQLTLDTLGFQAGTLDLLNSDVVMMGNVASLSSLSDDEGSDADESEYLNQVLSHYNLVMEVESAAVLLPESSSTSVNDTDVTLGSDGGKPDTLQDQHPEQEESSSTPLEEPVFVEDAGSSNYDDLPPEMDTKDEDTTSSIRDRERPRRRLVAEAEVPVQRKLSSLPSDFLGNFADGDIQAEDVKSDVEEREAMTVSWSSQSRKLQAALAQEQGPVMEAWYNVLVSELGQQDGGKPAWSVMMYGSKLGLTSLKLAMHYPLSLFVLATPEEKHKEAHGELLDLLSLANNLIAVTDLTTGVLGALEAEGSKIGYQILSHEAIFSLLQETVSSVGKDEKTPPSCSLDHFERLFTSLLSLSRTTFLELPSMELWLQGLSLLLPSCSSDFKARYLVRNSPYSSMGVPELQLLHACLPSTADVKILKRGFGSIKASSSSPYPVYGGSLLVRIDMVDKEPLAPSLKGRKGYGGSMTLSSLQHLGLIDEQRGLLARMFLSAPLWRAETKKMKWSASAIRYYGNALGLDLDGYLGGGPGRRQAPEGPALLFDAIGESGLSSTIKGIVALDQGGLRAEAQVANDLWETLQREISGHSAEIGSQGAFSIMEFGSGHGLLSLHLAKSFPSATVLSLEDSKEKTGWHHQMLSGQGLWNNIVCNGTFALNVMQKLYESPEFLRYHILRDDLLISLLAGNPDNVAGKLVGMLSSSGLTTFLRVPTATQAVLALSLFSPQDPLNLMQITTTARPLRGPVHRGKQQENVVNSRKRLVKESLGNFQLELLRRVIVSPSGGQTRVMAHSLRNPDGSSLPLLRLDIINMTRHVHHHFDHRKDGHTRTYTMHVVVNASETEAAQRALGSPNLSTALLSEDGLLQPASGEIRGRSSSYRLGLGEHITANRVVSVHLHRDSDQHFVPYTSIQAVTLIAIMRLGLLPRLRDRAYGRFLALPLYEDMAPWNIVFRGPELDYIDYDTRDVTFDDLVPKVYQILSVLMNYKRTVQDFEKCSRDKAKTPYGFPHVSDCVDDSSFEGSCKDPALPVPCGDGECHSDYISCLRALEKKDEGDRLLGASGGKIGKAVARVVKDLERLGGVDGEDEFDFDDHGVRSSSSSSEDGEGHIIIRRR